MMREVRVESLNRAATNAHTPTKMIKMRWLIQRGHGSKLNWYCIISAIAIASAQKALIKYKKVDCLGILKLFCRIASVYAARKRYAIHKLKTTPLIKHRLRHIFFTSAVPNGRDELFFQEEAGILASRSNEECYERVGN